MAEQESTKETKEVSAPSTGGNGKRKRAALILVVLVVIAVVIGSYLFVRSKTRISTDNAFVESHIYAVSARIPGNVRRVPVEDNQLVRKGDLLVELDPSDYSARVQNAEAQLNVARNETAGNYAQAEAARAAVLSDRAKLEQADVDLARGKALYRKEVIPKEQMDRLETARRVAKAKLAESEGSVRRALALIGLEGNGGKEAQVARKRAELEESKLNLSYTRLFAPADGYVTRKSVEKGNNVQPGQALMALVSLEESWIIANYKESQLTYVKPGQKVELTVDTYPGQKFTGVVDSIMAGTGAAFSLLPPENATGNYVKVVQRIPVKILVDKKSDPKHLLRVGMSVEPTVLTGRRFFDVLSDVF